MTRCVRVLGSVSVATFMIVGCQGPAATSDPQQNPIPTATPESDDTETSEADLRDNVALTVVLSPNEEATDYCSVTPYIRNMKKHTLWLTVVNVSGHKGVAVTLPRDIVEEGWETSAKLDDEEAWTFLLRVPTEPITEGYVYSVSCLPPEKAGPRVIVP